MGTLYDELRNKISPAEMRVYWFQLAIKLVVYLLLLSIIVVAGFRDWSHRYAWWILVLILPVALLGLCAGGAWIQWRKLDDPHKALFVARWARGSDADKEHAYESGPVLRALIWLLTAMNNLITGPMGGVLEILGARFAIFRGKSTHVIFYWLALLVAVAFILESDGAASLSIVLSALLIATFVYRSTAHLMIDNGTIRMLRFNAKPIIPSHIMMNALLMAGAFGVVYKHLSIASIGGFERPLSVDDAIYFSVITLGTVGYGDIHPVGRAAKWVCISEVTLGLMILIIALNATMTFWLQGAKKEEMAAWRREMSDKAKVKYDASIALAEQQVREGASPSTKRSQSASTTEENGRPGDH